MHTKANAAERLQVGEPSSGMSQALRSIRRAATQPSGGIAAVWVLNNVYKMEVGGVESEECAPHSMVNSKHFMRFNYIFNTCQPIRPL
jgi:hypothetical protein